MDADECLGIKWFRNINAMPSLTTNYCPFAYKAKVYILKYLLCKIFGVCIFYIDTSCGIWLEVKEIYGQNKVCLVSVIVCFFVFRFGPDSISILLAPTLSMMPKQLVCTRQRL